MAYEDIIYETSEGVAKITLNRPHVLNAMTENMMTEIIQAVGQAGNDETVRAIVITGAGRAFSPGKDVNEVGKRPPGYYAPPPPVGEAIEKADKPVIAAINGYCGTGALELMLACDLAVASENAVFADLHANIGLVHAGGASQILPRLIGIKRAKAMLFLSEKMTAQEAERIGLINMVVPHEELDDAVKKITDRLIENSALSLSIIKNMINGGMRMDLAGGMALEATEYRRFRERASAASETKERLKKTLKKD